MAGLTSPSFFVPVLKLSVTRDKRRIDGFQRIPLRGLTIDEESSASSRSSDPETE